MSNNSKKVTFDVLADTPATFNAQFAALAIAEGSSKGRVPILNKNGMLIRHVDPNEFRPGTASDSNATDPPRLATILDKDGNLKGYVDALALRRGAVSVESVVDFEKLRLLVDNELQAKYEKKEDN